MYKGLVCVLLCIAAVQALPFEDAQNIQSVEALPIEEAQGIASVQVSPVEITKNQPAVQGYPIEDAFNNYTETLRIGFPTGRVINGHEAVPHSAPYIVSLGAASKTHSHACGGTIISKEWVITAAHCILKNGIGMSIVAGLHARNNITDECQRRTVDFAKVHNGFTGGVGPNDIALLHVSKPFEFSDKIQPAVLPSWEEEYIGEGHIYGWGQPTWYNLFGANILQTVTTDVLEWNECNAAIGESPLVKSNICSSSRGEGISSCNGDSGGPLVKERENQPTELLGIVSWGFIPCGVANMPSVYTRVSAFLDWIHYIISSYEALQPHFL